MSLSGRDDTVVVDTTGWRGEHQAGGAEEKYMREAPEAPVLTQGTPQKPRREGSDGACPPVCRIFLTSFWGCP